MESIKLIITLISAEDLRCPYSNRPIKENAMAIIRTPSSNPGQVLSTTLDKNNNGYYYWNEKFTVDMPASAQWFDVEIRRGMDTVIGFARVPVSDFVNSLVPVGYLNFLSYRLQSQHGGFMHGIVNISVRVVPNNDQYCSLSKDKISLGRSVFCGTMGKVDSEDRGSANCSTYGHETGVVTGIPVSYGMNKM